MSLINDALKRAQQAPPVVTSIQPPPSPPMPVPQKAVPVTSWLIPAVVLILVMAAVFFIGWGVAHRSVAESDEPETVQVQSAPAASVPVVKSPVVSPVPPVSPAVLVAPTAPPVSAAPEPVNPLFAPKLQGIFYSPTDPTAILDGKTVHRGDRFKKYLVREIAPASVTLLDDDHKAIKLVMDN